jgi:two-component system cell cycle response regulator DivK
VTPALAPLVLFVDDHEDTRLLYVEYLQFEGFRAAGVGDGASALRAIREQRPDVIVMDVKMPAMDGFAVLDALKRDEELRTVPVVILTADAAPHIRRRALEMGSAEVVSKPCLPNDLLAVVRRMIAST